VRRILGNKFLWASSPTAARDSLWQSVLCLLVCEGAYYMTDVERQQCTASPLGAGAHAFKWFDDERSHAHLTRSQMHNLPLIFDDMCTICVFKGTVVCGGASKPINTAQMDAWLEDGVRKEMKRAGEQGGDSRKGVARYARAHGFVTCKAQLVEELGFANALRELALTPLPPMAPPVTLMDNSGEEYLLQGLRQAVIRLRTGGSGEESVQDSSAPSWLVQEHSQGLVLETIRTAEGGQRNNGGDVVGLITLWSTPVKGGSRKLWLLSQKCKTGGNGHWIRSKHLLHQGAGGVPYKSDWAPRVGLLGVAMVAGDSVVAPAYMQDARLEPLRTTMRQGGWDGSVLGRAAYALLLGQYPVPAPATLNHVHVHGMQASSLHSYPGHSCQPPPGLTQTPPQWPQSTSYSEEDVEEEGHPVVSSAELRAQVRAELLAEMQAASATEFQPVPPRCSSRPRRQPPPSLPPSPPPPPELSLSTLSLSGVVPAPSAEPEWPDSGSESTASSLEGDAAVKHVVDEEGGEFEGGCNLCGGSVCYCLHCTRAYCIVCEEKGCMV
jgi:hypothetical protein